ncbi:hypothetical protein [Caudoviricetes sp.]|nr:hypothetical protein [Caudoviricetes sp.]
MSASLIALTGVIYAFVAVDQWDKNPNLTIVYAGYAFSNIGLFLLAK